MTASIYQREDSMDTHIRQQRHMSLSALAPQDVSRRQVLGWGAAACGLLVWPSPAHGGLLDQLFRRRAASKQVQVFVDVSLSTTEEDRRIYEATFRELVERLTPGDKVILGLISDTPMPRFVPEAVRSLPRSGIELNDIEGTQRVQQDLAKDFERVKTRRRGSRSYILDTLSVAGELIASDEVEVRRSNWVVLLSDMIEDSEEARFALTTLDARQIHQIIERRKARRLLPDLRGALVLVAGASAADSRKYREIQEFWAAYFQSANAVCSSGTYGRLVPRFPSSRHAAAPPPGA